MKARSAMPGAARAMMPKRIARIPRTRKTHQWLRVTCTVAFIIGYLLFCFFIRQSAIHFCASVQTWENEKDTYSISPMIVRTDGLIYSIMGLFLLCRLTVRLFSRPFGRKNCSALRGWFARKLESLLY